MLNKNLFKEEIKRAYKFKGQEIPEQWILKIMYEDCIYLPDEVFLETMENLRMSYEKVTLPNILKSLPKYGEYDENGKRVNPPKKIRDYCKDHHKESYMKDKLTQYYNSEFNENQLKILKAVKDIMIRNGKTMYDFKEQEIRNLVNTYENKLDIFKVALEEVKDREKYSKRLNKKEIQQCFEYSRNYCIFNQISEEEYYNMLDR